MMTIKESKCNSDIAVSVTGLAKTYDKFAIDSISFDIPRGCITGIIGPNGAGKSTTINMLLGLIQPDDGMITVLGTSANDNNSNIRQYIGTVLDEGNFYDFLTLKQMTKIISTFYSNWDKAAYNQLSTKFNLDQGKKISELSKGMRMKYAISLALSHHAELLIMDEPTSGLDPIVREELLEILQEYMVDESKSVIFSTHITDNVVIEKPDLEKVMLHYVRSDK